MTHGIEHISNAFASAHREGRATFMPYFTLGYPTLESSVQIVETIANAGADLIELGVPFSDPLADGPTIQASTQTALENGASVARCLELVQQVRARGVKQPLLLMGYINPILAFGIGKFVAKASQAGVDGFIIPDLPPEEAGEMEAACRTHHRALVYLLAPTSTPERIALAAARSTGFLYLVSVIGVTGARRQLPPDLANFIARVRNATDLPLAVGFGIGTPQQAQAVGGLADGVIVGSALINAVSGPDQPEKVAALVSELHAALMTIRSNNTAASIAD
jgi:tryptophan synthase alpha chain